MLKALVLLLIAMLIGPVTPQAATISDALATIQLIPCSQGRNETPQLSIAKASNFPNLKFASIAAQISKSPGGGLQSISFKLPQGNYIIRVRAAHCAGQFQAALLSGHKRVLSLALRKRCPLCDVRTFATVNALIGSLPLTPRVAWLVASDGSKRVIDVQDRAYYMEKIYPDHYSIRLELHGGYQADISLDLSGISALGLVKHDIDIATLRKHLGLASKNGSTIEQCDWC